MSLTDHRGSEERGVHHQQATERETPARNIIENAIIIMTQGDKRSAFAEADREESIRSLAERKMPPKTLARRGSRRNSKLTDPKAASNFRGHESCPVITETSLEDLLKDPTENSLSNMDPLVIKETSGDDDVLDDSLHGKEGRKGFRRARSARGLIET